MAHYRKHKKKQWNRLMELAAEAGSIVMSMRDRPTRLDWLSVGLRSVALAARVHRDMRAANARDPWDYFVYDGLAAPWTPFPDALAPLVIKHARNAEVVMDHWDEQDDSERIYLAVLAGETVGWMADGEGRVREGPFMRSDREEETHAALGRSLWSQYGAVRLLFGRDGLSPDPLVGQPSRPTAQFAALLERIATVAHPDPHIVATLLGADADLVDRLGHLPLAYIAEFATRRDALGRDAALAELDDLIGRAENPCHPRA